MSINAARERNATASDNRYAAAKIGFVAAGDRTAMASAARQAGMTRVAPGQYQAQDKSWIMMGADGRIERGRGDTKWIGLPSRAASAATPGAAAPPRGGYTVESMRKTALGQLPMLYGNGPEVTRALRDAGFTDRGNRLYRHRDGSQVDLRQGYPILSFKGTDLSQLPRWW